MFVECGRGMRPHSDRCGRQTTVVHPASPHSRGAAGDATTPYAGNRIMVRVRRGAPPNPHPTPGVPAGVSVRPSTVERTGMYVDLPLDRLREYRAERGSPADIAECRDQSLAADTPHHIGCRCSAGDSPPL